MDLTGAGRALVVVGIVLIAVGAVLWLGGRTGVLGWLGRLPGDLTFKQGNTTVFIPLATSIVLSLVLSLLVSLFLRR